MSGPIVRKYGFPNHEAIFGKKEIEHGVDESGGGGEPAAESKTPKSESKKKPAAKKGKKASE